MEKDDQTGGGTAEAKHRRSDRTNESNFHAMSQFVTHLIYRVQSRTLCVHGFREGKGVAHIDLAVKEIDRRRGREKKERW